MFPSPIARPLAVAALIAVHLAVGAGPALAGKLKVPKEYPTIADAIAAASKNDVIQISTGTYHEQLVVPEHLVGLRVVGVGNVVIDADGVGVGPVIAVKAPKVRIESLTLRNAISGSTGAIDFGNGVSVWGSATGSELIDLTVLHCAKRGVSISASNTVVKSCRIESVETGVFSYSFTSDTRVEDCSVRHTEGGIHTHGDRSRVLDNRVHDTRDKPFIATAIYVDGVDSVAIDNTISNAGTALLIAGSANVAKRNTISACDSGLHVTNDSATIDQNEIEYCSGVGVWVNGAMASLRKNEVTGCNSGFSIVGTDATLEGNVARSGAYDGFIVYGARAELIDNRALDNGIDGFDIRDGVDHQLTANVALKNRGEGIEVHTLGTSLRLNVAKKNQLDIAATVPLTLFAKNVFQTGGPESPPLAD